jgi:hypothetical protein
MKRKDKEVGTCDKGSHKSIVEKRKKHVKRGGQIHYHDFEPDPDLIAGLPDQLIADLSQDT